MPTSSTIDHVLRRRADKLAKRRKKDLAPEEKTSVTVLSAGSEQFGIPTTTLSCIVKTPKLAAMPHLSPWIRGIAQVRGELVGVVDLAAWFGVPEKSTGAFMAVVEGSSGKLGLLVDRVEGFREVGDSDIADSFGDVASTRGHPIHATTKDLTAILDMDKLFANPDLRVDFGRPTTSSPDESKFGPREGRRGNE